MLALSSAAIPVQTPDELSFSCRHDSKRSRSSGPHDVLHRVSHRVSVPGLHSVLCAKGVLHHLRHHVCTELHPSHHQLQTASLLERGLETAAAAQAGLTATARSVSRPFSIKFILQVFLLLFFTTDTFPKNLKLIF